MMTEDEARKKWCPNLLSLADIDVDIHCVASDCMAWRWLPLMCDDAWIAAVKKAAEELGDKSPNRNKAAAHVNANRADYGLPTSPTHGFCGLAGRPE